MHLIRRTFKSGLLKHYLLSFSLVIFACILTVILSLYLPIRNMLKQDLVNNCKTVSLQMRNLLDLRFSELSNLTAQLSLNKFVYNFTVAKSPLSTDDIYTSYEIARVISNYKSFNSLASYVTVYFPNSSSIITPDGKYEADYFFSNVAKCDRFDSNAFRLLLETPHNNYCIPLSRINGVGPLNGNYITFIQTFPMSSKNPSCSILVFIDEKTLYRMIGDKVSTYNYNEQMAILDNSGYVIVLDDKNKGLRQDIMNNITESNGTFILDSKGSSLICAYSSSSIMDWKYIAVFNLKYVLEKLTQISRIAITIVVLGCLLGIAISFLLAKYNYKPWKSLIEVLRSSSKSENIGNYRYESDYAKDALKNIVLEKELITDQLNKNTLYIKSYILETMCNGKSIPEDEMKYSCINFSYIMFRVILIDLYNDAAISLPKPVLLSELESYSIEGCKILAFEDKNDRLSVIINSSDSSDSFYSHVIGNIKETIEKTHSVSVSLGIGSVYGSADKLYLSYNEAKQSLEYSFLKGKSCVIFYSDIKNYISGLPNLSIDSENRLINAIKAGDYKTCSRFLDEFFSGIINSRNISMQYAYCLYYNIISTLLKVCQEMRIDFEDVTKKNLVKLLDLSLFRDYKNMIDSVYVIYGDICEYIDTNKVNENNVLLEQVIKYINEHYMDKNLSLIEMSEKIGFSTSYLSRFMNEHLGMGFGDYINKVRISVAKSFLAAGSHQINEITDIIGYTSPTSFIRTFKRIEGITPGQYKEMLPLKQKNSDGRCTGINTVS